MPKTNDLAYFDSQRAFLFQIQTAIVFLQLETLTSSHADSKIFHREFASASYSAFSYHLAWFVKSATYSLLRGVVFTPLVYFLSGLTLSFMQYFIFMTVFCLMDLIGASLSLLLVSGIQKLETSSVLFTLTNSLAATSCGYFLRPQFIQVWFYWLFHSSWFKYGLNAMYINEFEDEDVLTNIFGVDQLNLFENVIILFIYPIVFNIGAYFSSCWLARPRKE